MKVSTQVILFMLTILVFGFVSILFAEFLREGTLDLAAIKRTIGKADMKVEDAIQNAMDFFK